MIQINDFGLASSFILKMRGGEKMKYSLQKSTNFYWLATFEHWIVLAFTFLEYDIVLTMFLCEELFYFLSMSTQCDNIRVIIYVYSVSYV